MASIVQEAVLAEPNSPRGAASAAGDERYAAARERYLKNLAALHVVAPELARRVDALPFADLPPLEPTRDGAYTVRLSTDDGQRIYLHSRIQPLSEAATLVSGQLSAAARRIAAENPALPGAAKPDNAETGARAEALAPDRAAGSADTESNESAEEPAEHSVLLVCGCGLGYVAAELEQRLPEPILLVAEADLALLKAALCVSDLSRPLRAGRLLFLTSAHKAELHELLRPLTTPLMLGLRIVAHPYAQRVGAVFQAELRAQLKDYVSYSRMQIVSLLRNARITCRNISYNLPHYLARSGVEVLEQRARGWPAILIAAGPSLARALDHLADLQDRAVLIAVQTVYKLLLARGIWPHFVTSLDYHEISAEFFRGIGPGSATVLVAEPKANYQVLDAFAGRAHLLHSGFADELLRAAAPRRGALRAGSTVAHLSFYLAEHLGCDPLILVGQDLSYSDGLYYPPGMPIEAIWRPELNRFQTVEMKQWERIARFRNILHRVPDIHGRTVYTDDQLFTYAEQFQADFAQCRARVILAGDGGMRLAGATVMPLAEAAARYCTRPLPLDELAVEATCKPAASAGDPAAAAGQLEARLREVVELRELSEQMRERLVELRRHVSDPPAFNRLLVRVDDLRTRLARCEATIQLVSHVSQLAELRRIQADRMLRTRAVETRATALRQLRRDQEFVEAFIDGCRYLERMLPEALARVRRGVRG